MSWVKNLTALGFVLFLSACQEAFDVSIVPGKATVSTLEFAITVRKTPEDRPRYDTVQLFEDGNRSPLWHLRAAPFGTEASQSRLRFGDTPDGFEAVVAAPTLEAGKVYVLVVSGREHGQLRFEVSGEGAVSKVD